MDERVRLFCGLRLPGGIVERLAAWQEEQLAGGRIVPREHLHVTTAFLGSTPASHVPDVASAVAAADAFGPIRFGVHAYRETRSVGMLVLGDVDGQGALYAEQLQEMLEILSLYERERRRWLPHVTVLRFRELPRLRPVLPDLGEFAPSDAAVFISRLHPAGARYEVVESFALGG